MRVCAELRGYGVKDVEHDVNGYSKLREVVDAEAVAPG